jgi:electron transport complex protein RnfD
METRELIKSGEILISHPPHIWKGFSTAKIMYIVLAVLFLPAGAAVYFFGLHALWVMLSSTATAVLVEFTIRKLRKKRFVMDGSAAITGLLLALTLPPRIPIWMVIVGSAFSIAIVKEAFGGLGYNIFNPALAGRAFLAICFPVRMTEWYIPGNFAVDAMTSATPLSESYIYEGTKVSLYKDLFFGNVAGSIGETSALIIIIGGLVLISLRLIDWRIPLIYIGTVAAGTLVFGQDAVFQIFAGGLMLGAFFMATDYVTSPVTPLGRSIFAFGAGIITLLIRNFGAMPEGVCFAILVMNALTPLIDKYVRPKPFGYLRKPAKVKVKN